MGQLSMDVYINQLKKRYQKAKKLEKAIIGAWGVIERPTDLRLRIIGSNLK